MQRAEKELLIVGPYLEEKRDLAKDTRAFYTIANNRYKNFYKLRICAVTSLKKVTEQPEEVRYLLNLGVRQQSFELAEKINKDENLRVVLIKYDQIVFGGGFGENLLLLLYALKKPIILLIDNTPETLNFSERQVFANICSVASRIILNSEKQKENLIKINQHVNDKIFVLSEKIKFDPSALSIPNEDSEKILNEVKVDEICHIINDYEGKKLKPSTPLVKNELLLKKDQNLFCENYYKNGISSITENLHKLKLKVRYIGFQLLHNNQNFSAKNAEIIIGNIENAIDKIFIEKAVKGISDQQEIVLALIFSELATLKSLNYSDNKIDTVIQKIFDFLPELQDLKAKSMSIKGLYHYKSFEPESIKRIEEFSTQIIDQYYKDAQIEEERDWALNKLYSAGCGISESLIYAYLSTEKEIYKIIGIITFDYLLSVIFKINHLKEVSSEKFTAERKFDGLFGSRSEDVAETIITLHLFHKVFEDELYWNYMKKAFSWFLGNNIIKTPVYFDHAEVVFDGIKEDGLIPNISDNAAIAYLCARLVMEINKAAKQKIKAGIIAAEAIA
jgi:hypothetical protein